MPKVVMQEIDNYNAQLDITILPEDYEAEYREALKPYAQRDLKGFRKGKTPPSAIQKYFGRPVLTEILHNILQRELANFDQEYSPRLVSSPVMDSDAMPLVAPDRKEEYTFRFVVDTVPPFELVGVDKSHSYKKYAVVPSDEQLDKQMDELLKRLSTPQELDEPGIIIEEADVLTLLAKEVDGEHRCEISLLVGQDILTETAYNAFLGASIGDTIEADVFDLEKDMDEKGVRKHLLHIKADDDKAVGRMFAFTIDTIKRSTKAEWNADNFRKVFGEENTPANVEEAKQIIREATTFDMQKNTRPLFLGDVLDKIMELNADVIPLPAEAVMARLRGKEIDQLDEQDYRYFKQMITYRALQHLLQVNVSEQELMHEILAPYQSLFGASGLSQDMAQRILQQAMADPQRSNEAYEKVIERKMALTLEYRVDIEEETLSTDDFKEMLEAKAAARQQKAAALATQEEEDAPAPLHESEE